MFCFFCLDGFSITLFLFNISSAFFKGVQLYKTLLYYIINLNKYMIYFCTLVVNYLNNKNVGGILIYFSFCLFLKQPFSSSWEEEEGEEVLGCSSSWFWTHYSHAVQSHARLLVFLNLFMSQSKISSSLWSKRTQRPSWGLTRQQQEG